MNSKARAMREARERESGRSIIFPNMLNVARYYRSLGWTPIAADLARAGEPRSGKVAKRAWKLFELGPPNDRELQHMFKDPSNIAVLTGKPSGIVFADGDSPRAIDWIKRNLPETPLQFETGRGEQFGFKYPGSQVPTKAHLKDIELDLRGDGGYSVVPPSGHFTGKQYRWLEKPTKKLLEETPVFPTEILADVRKYGPSSVTVEIEDRVQLVRRAMAYVAKMDAAIEGEGGSAGRHNRAMRVAGALIQKFKLSISESLGPFVSFNEKCFPKFSDRELLHKLEDAEKNLGTRGD